MIITGFTLLVLYIFFLAGGFKWILRGFKYQEPPKPAEVSESRTAAEVVTPDDRKKLERIAANYYHYALTPTERKYTDIWGIVRDLSTTELIEMIERFKQD